jgi:hypothetical protein
MKAAKARTNLKTDLAAEVARLRERAVASDARRGDYPASLQRAQRGSCGVIWGGSDMPPTGSPIMATDPFYWKPSSSYPVLPARPIAPPTGATSASPKPWQVGETPSSHPTTESHFPLSIASRFQRDPHTLSLSVFTEYLPDMGVISFAMEYLRVPC